MEIVICNLLKYPHSVEVSLNYHSSRLHVTPFVCSCAVPCCCLYLLKLLTVQCHGTSFAVAQLQFNDSICVDFLSVLCVYAVCTHSHNQCWFVFLGKFTFEKHTIGPGEGMNWIELNQMSHVVAMQRTNVYCIKWKLQIFGLLNGYGYTIHIHIFVGIVHGTKFTCLQIVCKALFGSHLWATNAISIHFIFRIIPNIFERERESKTNRKRCRK